MLAYIATILCAAALVVWVYQYDRYEKEPWYAVVLALAVGFGAMWVLGAIDEAALNWAQFKAEQGIAKAALIALIEETGKLITIVLFVIFCWRQVNDPMDGLIYGRLIGLGMAVEESLLYLGIAAPTLETIGVEIVRLFGHSLMAALIGFAVGIGAHPVHRRQRYPLLVIACFCASFLLHFGWNCIAYDPRSSLLHRLAPIGMMAVMMRLWHLLCATAETRSKALFAVTGQSDGPVKGPSREPICPSDRQRIYSPVTGS